VGVLHAPLKTVPSGMMPSQRSH